MKPHGLKQVRGIFGTALETSASSSISSTRSALRSRLAQQLRSTVQLQHDRWFHAYSAATRELHLLLARRVIPRMAPQPRSGTPSMLMHNVAVFFTVLDGGPQVDSARSALGSPVALAFEGGCNTARAAVQSLAAARKMAAGARRTVSRLAQRPHPCAHLRMARGAMQRLDAAQKATPARRVTPCMYNSCILGGGCSVARSATHRLTPTCEGRLRSAAEVTLSSMASAWRVMPCVTLGLPARWRRALSARGALSSTVALDTGSARNAAHSPAAALLKTTAARHLTPCSHRPLLNCATTWLAVPCINGHRPQRDGVRSVPFGGGVHPAKMPGVAQRLHS